MMLEMDWYCFRIDCRSGRRRQVTILLEMLTFIYKIYVGTLTLVGINALRDNQRKRSPSKSPFLCSPQFKLPKSSQHIYAASRFTQPAETHPVTKAAHSTTFHISLLYLNIVPLDDPRHGIPQQLP